MRTKVVICALSLFLYANACNAADEHAGPVTPEPHSLGVIMNRNVQAGLSPQAAVDILKEGNARFVEGKSLSRDARKAVESTAKGQHPLASLVGCMDSRVPVEMVLDQGVGDVFVARVAGNVISQDLLGSLEYAAAAAGAKAIVILGHTSCGAVKGACDEVQLGNLTALLGKIRPAVQGTVEKGQVQGDHSGKNPHFVDAVAAANVRQSMDDIRKQSPVLQNLEQDGKITIVGGMYDVKTGKVQWFSE